MAAKHIPKNERHTNTNKIAAPGGVTAMRGDFVLIPRKEKVDATSPLASHKELQNAVMICINAP